MLNYELMKQPLNWIIMLLMVYIAMVAAHLFSNLNNTPTV